MFQAIIKRYIQHRCRAKSVSCIPILIDIIIYLHSVKGFLPYIPDIHLDIFYCYYFTLLSTVKKKKKKKIEIRYGFFSFKPIVYLLHLLTNPKVTDRNVLTIKIDQDVLLMIFPIVPLLKMFVDP